MEEKSPLLIKSHLQLSYDSQTSSASSLKESKVESSNNQNHENISENATVFQTSLNIVKMCMGSGTLALPFAACQGGLIFHVIGLALVTLWNMYSVDRLLRCWSCVQLYFSPCANGDSATTVTRDDNYLLETGSTIKDESYNSNSAHKRDIPHKNTVTFGTVAGHAFGPFGYHLLDTIMLVLMFGIIISYEDAILGFIENTQFTTSSKVYDSIIMLMVIMPLACFSEMESLSKWSAIGNSLIWAIFIIIFAYGLHMNGLLGFQQISFTNDLWPTDFGKVSNWFGVVVFGYGVVPFTYDHFNAMEEPHQMRKATSIGLWIVFTSYVILSEAISIIFIPTNHGFKSDVLSALPENWLSTILRVAMALVISLSAPLIIIPTGNLVEQKLNLLYSPTNSTIRADAYWHHQYKRVAIRIFICLLCALVSIVMPNFVYVISFLGCVCVALLSFVYPPLLHLACLYHLKSSGKKKSVEQNVSPWILCVDIILLVWGIFTTIFTSYLTFNSMRR